MWFIDYNSKGNLAVFGTSVKTREHLEDYYKWLNGLKISKDIKGIMRAKGQHLYMDGNSKIYGINSYNDNFGKQESLLWEEQKGEIKNGNY